MTWFSSGQNPHDWRTPSWGVPDKDSEAAGGMETVSKTEVQSDGGSYSSLTLCRVFRKPLVRLPLPHHP